uniref:Uncharacterized protein n=1 Tax=Timspurckia oligopyrenoides TaxID=708627 RepID=A0A7S0ZLB9_9RHOD
MKHRSKLDSGVGLGLVLPFLLVKQRTLSSCTHLILSLLLCLPEQKELSAVRCHSSFVFGVDGTGKYALCERLQSEFNWKWVEAGDSLRSEVESSESFDGKLITECIEKGKSVPTEVTIKLI